MNPKVDTYINNTPQWQAEIKQLRKIALGCGLTEELKWGKPCYAYGGKNIVIIQGFKEYCALLFFKGVLLADGEGILVRMGENTEVGRQARFRKASEITRLAPVLKSYIQEAIEIEKAGLKPPAREKKQPEYPEELQQALKKDANLKRAFEALTPGRQKAYIMHFAAAKQTATRTARIQKCIPQILDGKGLNDYK